MSLAADKKKWDDLHAALEKATEAKDEFDRQLHAHYGRYEPQWLTKTQRAKLEALNAKEDKIGQKIFDLVERISPRDWSYGVASWWVRRELTWEDAIRPKNEPLSVVVPGSWGSPDGTVKERVQMPRKLRGQDMPERAEAAGEQYAYDQIASEYFGDWCRDQLLEASKMPPSDVLPLEDKHDAGIIAKNMLQQLEWDTKKGLGDREIKDLIGADVTPSSHREFYVGFKKACDASRDLLADELLTIKGEMGGGGHVEASTAGRTRLDQILDQVEYGKREVTFDTEGYTSEQRARVIATAKARGFHVSGSGRWLLIRNLGGVGETRTVNAKSRYGNPHPKYKPGKIYKHLKVDRVVPSHNAYRVEFNDGFSVQVHGGSGRDDILYAMRPYDTRLEQRAPGPESRRDYQYAALKAVLDGKPADFVVDHDGDVQARLTAVVRETHRPKAQGSQRRA